MEHPAPLARRPVSEWHRSGPERRLAGVCMALSRELEEPAALDRVALTIEDWVGIARKDSSHER
jgi:hypothetical protein